MINVISHQILCLLPVLFAAAIIVWHRESSSIGRVSHVLHELKKEFFIVVINIDIIKMK